MAKAKSNIVTYTQGSGYKVRLRGKRLNDGKISLYLDTYEGTGADGKAARNFEFLKMYLIGTPQTPDERATNNDTLKFAREVRHRREEDINARKTGTLAGYKQKISFSDYCTQYFRTYHKSDLIAMKLAANLFLEFTENKAIQVRDIRPATVEGFRDFLKEKYNFGTPLKIYQRFKKIIKQAAKDGFLKSDPTKDIEMKPLFFDQQMIQKEILTADEIEKLKVAKCENDVKRAFLFSVYSGLRFSDLKTLRYSDLKNGSINKIQEKTGNQVIVPLSPKAIEQLGDTQGSGLVFRISSAQASLKTLQKWVTTAGIDKHITWHCARHTFGSLLVQKNNNIRTIQDLMGHRTLAMTQRYTRISDSLKVDAVNSI